MTDDDPMFDADLSLLLEQHAQDEQSRAGMYQLGARMGAMHRGLVEGGMDPDFAAEIVTTWMRCAIFREVDRETGTHEG